MVIESQDASAPTTNAVADELARLLADTYTLYLKTHGYHWNVTGSHFRALHTMFEEQDLELREVVDEVAERIRALGVLAPASYRQLSRLSAVADEEGAPEAMDMVRRLAEGHEVVVRTARAVLAAAEEANDPVSLDIATRRIASHEKTVWMLRATLADG
jgi:starvation-inducible DNA-binding protein